MACPLLLLAGMNEADQQPSEMRGDRVNFRIRDVFLPTSEELLAMLHGDDRLQGRVVDLTRDQKGQLFAVVEVAGVPQPIVVASCSVSRSISAACPANAVRPTASTVKKRAVTIRRSCE